MQPSDERPLRIAFAAYNVVVRGWKGGLHYLKNVFAALRSTTSSPRVEIALLTLPWQRTLYTSLIPYVDQTLHTPLPFLLGRFGQRRLDRLVGRWGTHADPFLAWLRSSLTSYLRRHRVDVVFSPNELGPEFDLPLLGWLVDFQHLRLPEMFSQQEMADRNRVFTQTATQAIRVIVSSESARRDFEAFAPQWVHKARVLHFVAQPPDGVYDSDSAWISDAYDLPQQYVYLPNQFFKHKNHTLVVEALALLKPQYPEVTVVCTGVTLDYRDPSYFTSLLATLAAQGLQDNLRILGVVPYEHVFALMRQSLAVLQPSLFEGWSTTIEECKSLGKGMLLSDTPIHREQDRSPLQAVFFDPHNPQELADCLVKTFAEKSPGPDYALETLAREQLPSRTREFGQTFIAIAREAMESYPGR
jgi:glycosyltransferase involved in cell wall biosynthesis